MGRFISRNPIGEEGGLNLYAAFGNDPVNRWDYLGLSANEDDVSDQDANGIPDEQEFILEAKSIELPNGTLTVWPDGSWHYQHRSGVSFTGDGQSSTVQYGMGHENGYSIFGYMEQAGAASGSESFGGFGGFYGDSMAQGGENSNESFFSALLTGISVGVSITGTTIDGLEYSRYANSRFGGFWLGKDGKYYPTSWGGNGATGGKLKFAKAGINPYAQAGGRILGITSIGFGVYGTYQGVSTRDWNRAVHGVADAGFATWATFGGPIGWAAGGGYAAGSLINAVTGFDQRFADFWVNSPARDASSDRVIEHLKSGGLFW